LHLQPRPGEDVTILAGMLRVILSEELHDHDFVRENVDGLEELRLAVDGFEPEHVARRAGIDSSDLVTAARTFAAAERGYAVGATGPNMSGPGTLFEYLVLCLNTVCGRWLRAGELVATPMTLIAQRPPKAQANPPFRAYGYGEELRGSGLRQSLAGLPTAGLPEDILSDAPDRVRALVSVGGNPVAAWPDQLRTIEALSATDLLVQVDIKMSATARLADYVVAPKMSLETASFTYLTDRLSEYAVGYTGPSIPWAQYAEPLVQPPEPSDLIEEWEFFYGLARRMGLQLVIGGPSGLALDMDKKPKTEDILGALTFGARVPLEEVRKHPRGVSIKDPPVFVAPKDPGWTGRLDVGNEEMTTDLRAVASRPLDEEAVAEDGEVLAFRLISRRMQGVYNSSGRALRPMRRRPYNPAFMHPEDLVVLGLCEGDTVEIRSRRATILGVAEADDTLRRGLVSMSHAFGDGPKYDSELRTQGSPTGRLLSLDYFQPYTGQPQMSNIPVSVRRLLTGAG
jgi:anaerobic selenocysteine-containing dehydrogenase